MVVSDAKRPMIEAILTASAPGGGKTGGNGGGAGGVGGLGGTGFVTAETEVGYVPVVSSPHMLFPRPSLNSRPRFICSLEKKVRPVGSLPSTARLR